MDLAIDLDRMNPVFSKILDEKRQPHTKPHVGAYYYRKSPGIGDDNGTLMIGSWLRGVNTVSKSPDMRLISMQEVEKKVDLRWRYHL